MYSMDCRAVIVSPISLFPEEEGCTTCTNDRLLTEKRPALISVGVYPRRGSPPLAVRARCGEALRTVQVDATLRAPAKDEVSA